MKCSRDPIQWVAGKAALWGHKGEGAGSAPAPAGAHSTMGGSNWSTGQEDAPRTSCVRSTQEMHFSRPLFTNCFLGRVLHQRHIKSHPSNGVQISLLNFSCTPCKMINSLSPASSVCIHPAITYDLFASYHLIPVFVLSILKLFQLCGKQHRVSECYCCDFL